MGFWGVLFLALVCLSAYAEKDRANVCAKAAADLPGLDDATRGFVSLMEQLVVKGGLDADAISAIEKSEAPVNPIDYCGDIGEIPKHVYGQAFAKSGAVQWDRVRQFLRDTLLPRLRGTEVRRDQARADTARVPAPHVIATLPDVVSALKNSTHEEHGTAFDLAGKSWALVRSRKGLVLVDIATGETKTLSAQAHGQTETPVFFTHDGVPHLLTVEHIGKNEYLCDYDPVTGKVRRKFPEPDTFPLTKGGLATAVVDGKPYAIMTYSLSHYTHEPARESKPGIWLAPLDPTGGEPIRIDTKGRFLDDPKVGTVAGRTIIAATNSDGNKLWVADAKTGEKIKEMSIDTFGRYDSSRNVKDIRFYEDAGKPRVLVTTKTGFGIYDPLAGRKVDHIDVPHTDYSKGIFPVEANGKHYWITNGYEAVYIIDAATKKVTAVPFSTADKNDSVTTRLHAFEHRGDHYIAWGTFDGFILTAKLPGGEIVARSKISHGDKIMDLHMAGKSATRAVVVPFNEPVRIIDLLSGE